MKLLIDNALSPIVAERLGDAGQDVMHVRDCGLSAATDTTIMEVAASSLTSSEKPSASPPEMLFCFDWVNPWMQNPALGKTMLDLFG